MSSRCAWSARASRSGGEPSPGWRSSAPWRSRSRCGGCATCACPARQISELDLGSGLLPDLQREVVAGVRVEDQHAPRIEPQAGVAVVGDAAARLEGDDQLTAHALAV